MYLPLPDCLTIKESGIHGLGLFATKTIMVGKDLGVTHHFILDEVIRTPLGGFYNHSYEANCYTEVYKSHARLVTKKTIQEGEELTAFYKMFPLDKCSTTK